MGLFDKKVGVICGAKAGMLTRQKIAAGNFICGDCRSKCSQQLNWRQFENMSPADVQAHMQYMIENEELYRNEFRETYSINTGIMGGTRVISIDETNGWWIPAGNSKPDIIGIDQIISWRLELDTHFLSEEERRKPGRAFMPMPPYGMPACPPDQEISSMKVMVRVNHPWLWEVELNVMNAIFVTEGDIRAGYECAQQIFTYFEQAVGMARAAAYAAPAYTAPVSAQPAPASEENPIEMIKQLKELLDMGAITQEEFDAKKKQLLNL